MTKLGIIGAMQEEIETLLHLMENKTEKEIAGSVFHDGVLEGLPVTVVQCGIGKVNAALCAQILCDLFDVTCLVNTGIASSTDPVLMGRAFRQAVEAGRAAWLAGPGAVRACGEGAQASSPLTGFLR